MMMRRTSHALGRIVARMAKLSPPRHRELVRGMVAELDSVADPADRTRFAFGAITAIARLALSECGRIILHAPGRFVGASGSHDRAHPGGSSMSKLTTAQLVRRHAMPFAVSLGCLTVLLLADDAVRRAMELRAKGFSAGAIGEVLVLTVPHTAALTIPMAVFIAVSWVFSRLGLEGVLASASRARHGVRRLLTPVMGAAAVIAALTFVWNTQVDPRANARLGALLAGAPLEETTRTMTVGELREAARVARVATGAEAAARAAEFEMEAQRKLAFAAACMFLALAAAATSIRFPRGGGRLVLGASAFVFTGYLVSAAAGESLSEHHMISPLAGAWLANAFLLAVGLLLLWRPGRSNASFARSPDLAEASFSQVH